MTETDDSTVRVELTLPGPFDTVWQWVRDPALVDRWHGWEYEGLADEIEFMFVSHAVADEAARTLQIGNHLFTFEERGAEVVVRLTRSAPALEQEWSDEYYDMVEHGWTVFLQQLRFALARHRDDVRRTVFVYGRRSGPAMTSAALGLAAVAELPPGSRYEASLPTGDSVAGEVWFATDHELGVTVDGWGDGLLVVGTEAEDVTDATDARSMAVLTTYGLDDAALADLRARWTAWWATTHRAEELQAAP
jgi:hypothetical protein